MAGELAQEYDEYLARFAENLGDVEVGGFAKYNGKLIKKLNYEAFEALHRQYTAALNHYEDSLERGDTINDLVVKSVRDRANELILSSPV